MPPTPHTKRPAPPGRSWLPITLFLVLLISGAGIAAYVLTRPSTIPTVTVTKGTVVRAFYATGVVRPDFEYILKSKAQGALLGLDKREGSVVKKGERIATVDDKQLRFEVEKTTAELAEAKKQTGDDAPNRLEILARLAEAKQQTDLAKENLDRTQGSFDRKAANYTDLDAARRIHVQWINTIAALEGQLGTWKISSQRAVDVAAANLRKAEANLADADVRAPIDGVILERYVENQEVVGINQKLLLIAAADDLLMKAAVDEEDVTRTFLGQKVKMQLYAFQDRDGLGNATIMDGKVVKILPSANPANKTYEVKIEFVDRPPTLLVGMTGELNFIEKESAKDASLVVPSSAVLDKKAYKARPGSRHFDPVDVKVGVRSLDKVEILEGLTEGDTIVLDAKQVAPVKLPPTKPPVVPTRTGDEVATQ